MKSTKRVRYVRYLHVKMRSTPYGEFGQQLNLLEILRSAQTELNAGRMLQRQPPAQARVHVRIVDITFTEDDRYAAILFRLIDKDEPDAVYEDMESGELEEHRKGPGQGNRFTAHLVLSLHDRTTRGDEQTFRGLLEVVGGVSRELVQQRMCSVGRMCGRDVGSRDGGVTSDEFHAVFEVVPFVERTIREELQSGVLDRFTLEHAEEVPAGYDEDDLLLPEKRKLEVKVLSTNRTLFDRIYAGAREMAREGGYELIRAHYENADGNSASQKIYPERENALEELVTKTAKIVLDVDMHPNHVAVDTAFTARMIGLLG